MRSQILIVLIHVLSLFSIASAFAQTPSRTVEGLVVDSTGLGLKGVSVRLVSSLDSMTTSTNKDGFYTFTNVQGKNLHITYSMLGFQIVSRSVSANPFINQQFIPQVTMQTQTTLIPEVRVVRVIPIIERGDTIQFNLKGFDIPPNSLLEAALRQLPGFQVLRDGTTFYNGEPIKGVKVDGKLFFGGDLLTATQNLPSNFVRQIEVINDYGELAAAKGIKDTKPEKIINIVLEDDKKQIIFGNATAGAGTLDRYIASLGINRYDNGRQLSIIGSMNNTNTNLFSFGSPDGSNSRSADLTDVGDFSDQADGLNRVSNFNLSFVDTIGSRMSISGVYNYQNKQNKTEGSSLMTSSYSDYKINKRENFFSKTDDNIHRLQLNFKAKFKNNDELSIRPELGYSYGVNRIFKESALSNRKIRDVGHRQDTTNSSTPTATLEMIYSKHFEKKGRRLVGLFKYNYQSTTKDDFILENFISYDSTTAEPTIRRFQQRQYVDSKNDMSGINASISYVEPFFENSLLEVKHDMEINRIEARRLVYDPLSLDGGLVDSLGLDYAYEFKSFKTGLNYQYEPNKRFRVNMDFTVQPVMLQGRVQGDTTLYDYDNVNLVPSTTIRYKFKNDYEVLFSYLGMTIQPNFLHISPVRNTTNSRNIIVGNPSLKAEFSNKFAASLSKFIPNRMQYFQTDFSYTFISNKIVGSKFSLANETIQQTTFENTDGYYELKWGYQFDSPIFNDDFSLNILGNLDYYNNLSFVNHEQSTTKQLLYNQNLQLRYNWSEYFESVFNTNYFLNRAVYDLPYKNEIAAHSFLLSLAGRGYINDQWMLGAEMSQKFYDGYVRELSDVNPTIINTYVQYSFLKNRLATVRLQCNDLMDQNKNVGVLTEYVGNDVFESRNNRLGRYFMLSLNLRLQSFPKKQR